MRKGQEKTVKVTLGELPSGQPARAETRPDEQPRAPSAETVLGLSLAPARKITGVGSQGVVVTQVDPSGQAAESGLDAGDIILDVGGKSVNTAADVRNAVNEARSHAKRTVLLRVKSGQNTRYVAVPVG